MSLKDKINHPFELKSLNTEKKSLNNKLDELIKFGPSDHPTSLSEENANRIREIVKKLQEISKRIERLSQQY